MLSQQTRAIIAATLPAVKANAEEITGVFYPLMFERYPEVRDYFNLAHQAQGSQRRALANAVVAYASNLDRLELLGDAVNLIVHKHASLNIQPEHYPLVGECLLAAVREVLGAAATDEVLAAWGEAYQQLADILIAAEEQLYREHQQQPGGWRGEREFVLARRERESAAITSFYLQPADGGPLPPFQPGQYISLILELDGQTVRRNYSLSDVPGQLCYRISVKREPGGQVSAYLHDHLQVGDRLRLTPPCGNFVLNEAGRPLVLLSGGVGITPTISMLQPTLDSGREVYFLHGALNSEVQAFRSLLETLDQQYPNLHLSYCYSDPLPQDRDHPQGLFDSERLAALLPGSRDLDVYFLGPPPFMQLCYRSLRTLGIPDDNLRYEFFGPLQALQSDTASNEAA
ncbi:NO-inducible flavohemoprotein [Kineobactrum salinum]|uniref:Flavohemoprotein n=1 Tax=Kineobactrum salinum TaxID=2708301 RepID=A0A6C0U1D6_9GAMM|nr:NO-inducible flavohemoprotein [Kineobactrum salinum]QIB65826.1 NO-inducible flavohemoprotein [Kineobactrum salinum]